MIKTLSLMLLIFIVSCKSDTELKRTYSYFSNGKPADLVVYPDKADTTTGTLKVFYPSGQIYIEASLHNNKYVGRKVTYYESGKYKQIDSLSEPCDSSSPQCDGTLIRYYENGNVSQRYIVKNNKFNGLTQQYRQDGTLAKEYELANGLTKNGRYCDIYPNGKLCTLQTFQNDTVVGFTYFFDEDGDTLKYFNHYNGNFSFPYKKWIDKRRTLYGDYVDTTEREVLWIWCVDNKELKRKIMRPTKDGFVVPQ